MAKKLFFHINWFLKKSEQDSIDAYSAQVSYFLIISFIPFILIFLSFLSFININGTSLLLAFVDLLPTEASVLIRQLLELNFEPIALISISALTCVWSSSKAMLTLIKGMNSVFDVNEKRNFIHLRIAAMGYTIVFVGVLIATIILLLIGNAVYENIFDALKIELSFNILTFKWVLGIVILTILFTCFYKLIPQKSNVSLKNCFIGALLASICWALFSVIFSFVVENFLDYSVIYGALASLIILMLWLYFCIFILFLGGEFAVWMQLKIWKNYKLEEINK